MNCIANHVSENIPYCTKYCTGHQTLRSLHEKWCHVCTVNSSRDWKRKDFSRAHTWMPTSPPPMATDASSFRAVSSHQQKSSLTADVNTKVTSGCLACTPLWERGKYPGSEIKDYNGGGGGGRFSESSLDDVDWFQSCLSLKYSRIEREDVIASSRVLNGKYAEVGAFAASRTVNRNGRMRIYCLHAWRSSVWIQLTLSEPCATGAASVSFSGEYLPLQTAGGTTLRSERLDILLDATRLVWQ